MRMIKFRAKALVNKEWVYGDLHIRSAFAHIHTDVGASYKIDTDTIGQFTGLLDKNGKEIYEGDIVDFDDKPYCVNGSKYQGAVVMHNGAWCVQHYEKCFDVHLYSPLFADDFANRKTIILGNIHDNTELLKEDEA